ncbi:MAG: septum formation initiator family protein [Victivallaceae bacterium]
MDDKKKKIVIYFFYLIVVLLIISSAILILPVYQKYQKDRNSLFALKEQAAIKTAECIRLNREVYKLEHSPDAVEKVAREKFGLCREGETVMRYKVPDAAKKRQ